MDPQNAHNDNAYHKRTNKQTNEHTHTHTHTHTQHLQKYQNSSIILKRDILL